MTACCRFLTPFRSYCGLAFLAVFMLGGLAWVSIAALRVEAAEREADARAKLISNERIALWRLDAQMLTPIGLENNRPYAHYFALHIPSPVVLTDTGEASLDPGRIPSPLLSTDLPSWVRLHFHIDPVLGWESPQVISNELANRLNTDPIDISLANCTTARDERLAYLREQFPASSILGFLGSQDLTEPEAKPYIVPVPLSDEPSSLKPAPAGRMSEPAGWGKPYHPHDKIPQRNSPSPRAVDLQTNASKKAESGSEPNASDAKRNRASEYADRERPAEVAVASPAKPGASPAPGVSSDSLARTPPPTFGGRFSTGRAPSVDGEKKDANKSAVMPDSQPSVGPFRPGNASTSRPTGPAGDAITPLPAPPATPTRAATVSNGSAQSELSADGYARKQLAQSVMNGRGSNEGKFGGGKGGGSVQQFEQRLNSTPDDKTNETQQPSSVQSKNLEFQKSVADWAGNLARNNQLRSQESVTNNKAREKVAESQTEKAAGESAVNDRRSAGTASGALGSAAAGGKPQSTIPSAPTATPPAPGINMPPGAAFKPMSRPEMPWRDEHSEGVPRPTEPQKDPAGEHRREYLAGKTGLGEAESRRQADELFALAKPLGLIPGNVNAGERKPSPIVQPVAVHLGSLRPRWVTAADGTEHLFLVRAALVDDRTIYQGIDVDWTELKNSLVGQVADLFPKAELKPVRANDTASAELTMTTLPARLDTGPGPELPPVGWSPLRIGLVLAWVAALLAITAVGVGGRTVMALSERRIRFVSAVTHELRSPMTAMQLHLDLLASGMIEDEARKAEYLTTVSDEATRLTRLVENVLDFARLEKRAVQANARPMPVTELISTISSIWSSRLEADGFELVTHATTTPEAQIHVDPRVVMQVLGNLLDNARKYAKQASDRRIWLWAKPGSRGRIALEIEDRGPGIPSGERRQVFKPFRRGSTHTESGGVGLGLSLARQWAEICGGSLTYRPADGDTGACFRLELPVG